MRLEIEQEEGVSYTTQFIGTRRGYERYSEPILSEDGRPLTVTRRYSDDVGQVLAVVDGTSPVIRSPAMKSTCAPR